MWTITLAAWIFLTGQQPVELAPRPMPNIETCWAEARQMQSDFVAVQAHEIKHAQLDVSCISEWFGGDPA